MTVVNKRSSSEFAESRKRKQHSSAQRFGARASVRAAPRERLGSSTLGCADMRDISADHLREESPALLPQIVIHITSRLQAQSLLGNFSAASSLAMCAKQYGTP